MFLVFVDWGSASSPRSNSMDKREVKGQLEERLACPSRARKPPLHRKLRKSQLDGRIFINPEATRERLRSRMNQLKIDRRRTRRLKAIQVNGSVGTRLFRTAALTGKDQC